ncbi:MAG: hypothetical protein L6407_03000 [Candidatus Delongbacteria bacterium]|nr:hypothetical protein [Candidatus Delongbacteria bacterium]
MNLNWIKCDGSQWCNFFTLNLNHEHFNGLQGVYIIWHGGQKPLTVYVGKGEIKNRILLHRQNPNILKYSHLGLFVTWAFVDSPYQEGVERYLANNLNPLECERSPEVVPIQVNFPW